MKLLGITVELVIFSRQYKNLITRKIFSLLMSNMTRFL